MLAPRVRPRTRPKFARVNGIAPRAPFQILMTIALAPCVVRRNLLRAGNGCATRARFQTQQLLWLVQCAAPRDLRQRKGTAPGPRWISTRMIACTFTYFVYSCHVLILLSTHFKCSCFFSDCMPLSSLIQPLVSLSLSLSLLLSLSPPSNRIMDAHRGAAAVGRTAAVKKRPDRSGASSEAAIILTDSEEEKVQRSALSAFTHRLGCCLFGVFLLLLSPL